MSLNAWSRAAGRGFSRRRETLDGARRADVWSASQAMRDLETDLRRLSGRLSHLVTVNYKLALENCAEIHATLNEVRETMRRMQPAIAALQAEMAESRAEIVRVLCAVNAVLKT
jgi:chromosome segregation ATPase